MEKKCNHTPKCSCQTFKYLIFPIEFQPKIIHSTSIRTRSLPLMTRKLRAKPPMTNQKNTKVGAINFQNLNMEELMTGQKKRSCYTEKRFMAIMMVEMTTKKKIIVSTLSFDLTLLLFYFFPIYVNILLLNKHVDI